MLSLCVPAERDDVPPPQPPDAVTCYKAKVAKGTPKFTAREVQVVDAYEVKQTRVKVPKALCLPVSIDGSPVGDPAALLTCYKTADAKGQPKFAKRSAAAADPFGARDLLLKKASLLCVPGRR